VSNYDNLPQELRDVPQWCIAGPEKAPYYVTGTAVVHASVHKPSTWKTFAASHADMELCQAQGIGFVLSTSDPWTCIDIDVCNAETQRRKGVPIDPNLWTTEEQIARYQAIVAAFDSYTEISTMGWGLHIWVKGFIGAGVKYDGVEVYSHERFMICTGKVYVNRPIADRQEMLDNMVSQMRGAGGRDKTTLVEIEPEDTDMEVYERASSAENAAKFNALAAGEWSAMYPSQSEADLSLMSMFCFYTKSNEQCRRLFRCTGLGQREKANKNDKYLNYTLEIIRGRQAREDMITDDAIKKARDLVKELQGSSYEDVAAGRIAATQAIIPEGDCSIPWPPGLAGVIAGFIYNSSIRPVKEVAIVGALGFLAGVCGKAFNIPQSGLNMYIVLVAPSGVGKEAMHSGLSLICQNLQQSIPGAQNFVDFTEFASSPALMKTVAQNPSFVNVVGEFGKRLKRFSDDQGDGPMTQLRTTLTNLYQKSAAGNMVGGLAYSDKDKNVATMSGVAYSMIGESTPDTFYQALTPTMMEDGFLSRFLIVDYPGERPARNHNPVTKMDDALGQALHGLCNQSMTLISKFMVETVVYAPDARDALDKFDLECDAQINSTRNEAHRQMWNRAHLKVCRLAGILAASDNWFQPVMRIQHVEWALDVVRRDIAIMSNRLENGDVGADDGSRERKAVALLRDYLMSDGKKDSYGQPPGMSKSHIISKRLLHARLSQLAQFKNTREGSARSVDLTLKTLIDSGYLSIVDKAELVKTHGFHGIAYRIVSIPPIVH
jgi:hypothetical protein